MNLNDLIGTIGVGIILLAYFLNMFSYIQNNGKLFYLLNIIGASIACFASYLINYIPFVILEGTWALVSVVGLVKSCKKI
ncbi:hypothetical protein [Flavobacterium sp.]|uniref:CBU_0592 family membrane protein n=1 Tax=Flavobacterium sp. TaxID=239 RepID=UPI0026237868|nr:hypothetical protein [Flavobacterium sp.]